RTPAAPAPAASTPAPPPPPAASRTPAATPPASGSSSSRGQTAAPEGESCSWVVQCVDSGPDAGKCVSTRVCGPK
ncbi:hypothetical protein, partial [Caenispirillum bisanense]|uniref:hypothetical protein n=1 Tax=Caenispirillum bisanense TaxID=414052 RepID=UPI0031E1A9A0